MSRWFSCWTSVVSGLNRPRLVCGIFLKLRIRKSWYASRATALFFSYARRDRKGVPPDGGADQGQQNRRLYPSEKLSISADIDSGSCLPGGFKTARILNGLLHIRRIAPQHFAGCCSRSDFALRWQVDPQRGIAKTKLGSLRPSIQPNVRACISGVTVMWRDSQTGIACSFSNW